MSRLIDADTLMEIYADRLTVVADRYSPNSSECGILSGVMKLLDAQPTIEPEQRWISCSERLPEHRLYVLVTYKYEYGLIDNGITWYSETENKWNTSREVIAWMPLPEPYKGGTDE